MISFTSAADPKAALARDIIYGLGAGGDARTRKGERSVVAFARFGRVVG
ncbi:hypothetical protein ACVC7O_04365 [Roseobacter sp. A03A-229]